MLDAKQAAEETIERILLRFPPGDEQRWKGSGLVHERPLCIALQKREDRFGQSGDVVPNHCHTGHQSDVLSLHDGDGYRRNEGCNDGVSPSGLE